MQTAPTNDPAAPRFRILGFLRVCGHDEVVVTARRQQVVLALLLLNPNRVVPVESMVTALWDTTPPATARAQVQTCVYSLRRALASVGLGERIAVRGLGYAIELAPGELDVDAFDALVGVARAARRPADARRAYREALALCQGEPLTGIESALLRAHQVRIAERRLEVLEECLDVELGLGLHRAVVGELTALVAEHPLRERFAGQLMTALAGCGRQVDALSVFRQLRQTFVDELGLEPSARIRQLHQDILTGGATDTDDRPPAAAAPQVPPAASVPRMLPAQLPNFTGHDTLLATLRRRLSVEQGPDAPLIAVLAGSGGVGRTAVAVEAAHRLAGDFPDGQLYARLAEDQDRVGNTAAVLEKFLWALGFTAAAIPADLDGRAALFRSAVAGRRVLMVVEDAEDEAQLRPLVPGTPGCRLIVTTRARAAVLPGSVVFELDVLDAAAGVELLTALADAERIAAEPDAARAVVELCGGLQLALAGAAVQLAIHPHWSVADLACRLRAEDRRLDLLCGHGVDVRAVLRRATIDLGPVARILLHRLGLLEGGSFSAWAAAPLLDLDPDSDTATDALEELVDARVVDVSPVQCGARYRLHELVRIHAREQVTATESVTEREDALLRLLAAWLSVSDEAVARHGFTPAGTAPRRPVPRPVLNAVLADPLAWYAAEAGPLLAAVEQAARLSADEHCWNLAVATAELGGATGRLDLWRAAAECALTASQRAGNRRGEAAMRDSLDELDLREHRAGVAARRIEPGLVAPPAERSLWLASGVDLSQLGTPLLRGSPRSGAGRANRTVPRRHATLGRPAAWRGDANRSEDLS